jgi:hypothetical protein
MPNEGAGEFDVVGSSLKNNRVASTADGPSQPPAA